MQLKKLLIIDPSDDFCDVLFNEMKTKFTVKVCLDGETGLNTLLSWKPDTLVINPVLRGLDGLTLLERAISKGICPSVLMITSHSSDYLEEKANQLNIDYLMMKTCPVDVLSARICDLSQKLKPAPPSPNTFVPIVTNILEELGVDNYRDGFGQLQVGIPLLVQNRDLRFTKELYPSIGELLRINPNAIEKTIRDAIQAAWKHRDEQIWSKYFPVDHNGKVMHQTNKSFMLSLADHISRMNPSYSKN